MIVKFTRHATGTVKRIGVMIEYLCDCHKQFRMAKSEHVTKLKPKRGD